MTKDQNTLILNGSVAAAARIIGEQAAAEALYLLTDQAPIELQGDWTAVLNWGRWQQVYEIAFAMDDSKMMAKAIEGQEALIRSVY